MTNCITRNISFSSYKSKKVEVNFNGGDVTSDGGVLLLREIDRKLGLTKQISKLIPDERDQRYVDHSIEKILAIILNYRNHLIEINRYRIGFN